MKGMSLLSNTRCSATSTTAKYQTKPQILSKALLTTLPWTNAKAKIIQNNELFLKPAETNPAEVAQLVNKHHTITLGRRPAAHRMRPSPNRHKNQVFHSSMTKWQCRTKTVDLEEQDDNK